MSEQEQSHSEAKSETADAMAGSGDRSEGENEMDLRVPASEDPDMAAAASEVLSPPDGPPGEPPEPRKWKWAVMFLCFYGFMVSMKPGEAFLTPYLLSAEKNFTLEQVSGVIRLLKQKNEGHHGEFADPSYPGQSSHSSKVGWCNRLMEVYSCGKVTK